MSETVTAVVPFCVYTHEVPVICLRLLIKTALANIPSTHLTFSRISSHNSDNDLYAGPTRLTSRIGGVFINNSNN